MIKKKTTELREEVEELAIPSSQSGRFLQAAAQGYDSRSNGTGFSSNRGSFKGGSSYNHNKSSSFVTDEVTYVGTRTFPPKTAEIPFIHLYSDPPVGEFSYKQIEYLGKRRLALLYAIEDAVAKCENKAPFELMKIFDTELGPDIDAVTSDSRSDHLSHWVVRFVFAEQKDRFIAAEAHLYKARLERYISSKTGAYRSDKDNKATILLEILKKFYSEIGFDIFTDGHTGGLNHITIPFEDAAPLLSKFKVWAEDGFVKVPASEYASVAKYLFTRNIKVGF